MSTNILCANLDCRHWFNYTAMLNLLDDLNRVEPTEQEKQTQRTQAIIISQRAAEQRREEGRQAYLAGDSIESLRKDPPYGGYAEPATNIDRMAGYLDAMAEDVRLSRERF